MVGRSERTEAIIAIMSFGWRPSFPCFPFEFFATQRGLACGVPTPKILKTNQVVIQRFSTDKFGIPKVVQNEFLLRSALFINALARTYKFGMHFKRSMQGKFS